MLTRQSTAVCSDISVDALGLLVRELGDVVPILLQTICDLICRLRITQLEDGIIVHCPVLGFLVGTPDLLAFDAEDLDANTAWRWDVIRNELRSERGVTHDTIVAGGLCEHALSEMCRKVVVDNEFAYYALRS